MKVTCIACGGRGWYVDFQLRRDCPPCGARGYIVVEDDDGDVGVPDFVEHETTKPIFVMPHVTLDDDDVTCIQ